MHGPEVAFNLTSKSSSLLRLSLGTHNCNGTPLGPIYEQFFSSWEPVHYYSAPATFCMLSWGTSGAGSFSGTLAWD